MTTSPDRRITDMGESAALPRKNGELVFEAPWEGRAFGIAVALNNDRLYEWSEFRDALAAKIAVAQQGAKPSSYYEQWLGSLEKLVVSKGFITGEELDTRTAEYASGERHDDS
jgi:nitrile hydratase accessory protein